MKIKNLILLFLVIFLLFECKTITKEIKENDVVVIKNNNDVIEEKNEEQNKVKEKIIYKYITVEKPILKEKIVEVEKEKIVIEEKTSIFPFIFCGIAFLLYFIALFIVFKYRERKMMKEKELSKNMPIPYTKFVQSRMNFIHLQSRARVHLSKGHPDYTEVVERTKEKLRYDITTEAGKFVEIKKEDDYSALSDDYVADLFVGKKE